MIQQNHDLVKLAHEKSMSVTIWTCGSKDPNQFAEVKTEMRNFLKLGVDAIFTDNPDLFPR